MKTNKKIYLFIGCIVIIILFISTATLNNNNNYIKVAEGKQNEENQKISDAGSNIRDKEKTKHIFLEVTSQFCWEDDIFNPKVREELSEYIIIGTIDSIDGAINYDPVEKTYTIVNTIGKVKVNKVIKGNLKEEVIPFMRMGGIISVEDYEKGLDENQKVKQNINKLNREDKKKKYVSEKITEVITNI